MKRVVTACLALSALLLAGLPSAADTVFASSHLTFPTPSKLLCQGEPSLSSPATCTTTTSPGPGAAVFYAIQLGPNTPAGTITLLETLPQGFNYVSANCTVAVGTNIGQSTTLVRSVAGLVSTFSSVTLVSGQTVYCFIRGYFTNPGASVQNSVTVADANGAPISSAGQHNAIVATTSVLPSDLSVVKTVDPGLVNVTQGAQTLTYTVVIKNNGPEEVWIGTIGELFDNVSISSTGVPMQVQFVTGSGVCTSSPSGTACLDPIPVLVAPPWSTVTTIPLAFAKWQFPSSGASAAGYIPSLGTITLTYEIEVRRHEALFCAKGGEKLRNKVFFGLTRISGVTITESNSLNNTSASPDVPVNTGQENDPECALPDNVGPIQIVKTQISPSANSTVPWGASVTYRVTVTNSDLSSITVRLRDRVMQWAGTPPFSATVQSWNCVLAGACATAPPATTPTVNLFSYFQTKTAWNKSNLTVPGKVNGVNGKVVLKITLKFTPNSCDSFANGGNIIRNIGRVNYAYSPPGAPLASFMAEAFVDTKMAAQPLCVLRVKKTVFPAMTFPPTATTKVNFGTTIKYTVTYRNGGTTPVSVGTLIDAVRIVQPNYATSLPFVYKYSCDVVSGSVSGSPGAVPADSMGYPSSWIPGSIVYTTFPSQGTRIIQNSLPISFSSGAQLNCSVQIKVSRPATGDPNCLSSVTPRLENLALMDVSRFYNPNVPWPPSQTYSASFAFGATQPTSPLTNWSTVGLKLPKCYKFVVNKSVLPNLTWAPGGPSPLTYTVVVTNQGDALTGQMISGAWHGPFLGDQFFTPSSGTIVPGSVNATSNCSIPPNQLTNWDGVPGQSRLRISSFPAGCTITLSLEVEGPYTPNQTCNRGFAGILPTGTTNWYNNSPNPNTLKSEICAPVLNTNSLTVRKSVTNNSGDVLPVGALFPVTVSCSVPGGPTLTFSINASSTPVIVNDIPVGSTCTITESSTLPLPQPVSGIPINCKLPLANQWAQPSYVPTQVVVIAPSPTVNIVSIINTLNCAGS